MLLAGLRPRRSVIVSSFPAILETSILASLGWLFYVTGHV